MTPVAAQTTSSGTQPTALAAAAQTRSAFSSPWGAQALALPLLMTATRALPLARWALSTWIWAAFTTFFVYTAAQAQSTSETIMAMSFFHSAWVLTPTWMPPARKPWAAQTPPSINFSIEIPLFGSEIKMVARPARTAGLTPDWWSHPSPASDFCSGPRRRLCHAARLPRRGEGGGILIALWARPARTAGLTPDWWSRPSPASDSYFVPLRRTRPFPDCRTGP